MYSKPKTVEIIEAVNINTKDMSAKQVADEITNFCDSYGEIARHMWKIVAWDIGHVKLSRRYIKEV